MENETYSSSKPEINKTIRVNRPLDELVNLWGVKFDLKTTHENKIYFTSQNKPGNVEERISEVYEIKGDLLTRNPNRIVFTWDNKIIGIGEVKADVTVTGNMATENHQPVAKARRLGATTMRNKKEMENKQHDESRNKLFHSHFLTQRNHLEVIVDNLLNEVNVNCTLKFDYQIIQELSKLKNLYLNNSPKFIFYKMSDNWNVLLLRKNPETKYLEGICKEVPVGKDAILLKSLTNVQQFVKYNCASETTDTGLQAVEFVISLGCDYYPENFKPIEILKQKRIDLIRWPLLIDMTLKKLTTDNNFKRDFNESMIQIPEVNDQSKKYRQLLSKFTESDDDDSGIDENMIKELEESKKEMLVSYADDIKHFETQYEYNEEDAKNQNEVKMGSLKIDKEYSRQLLQLNVVLDLFKQYYEKNKLNSEPLIDEEVQRFKTVFISEKLQKRMEKYLFEKTEECSDESENESSQIQFKSKATVNRIQTDFNKLKLESAVKSVSEIISEINLNAIQTDNNALCDFKKVELGTKANLMECNYYQNQIKNWSEDEIKHWSKTIKGYLLNSNHALLTSIAIMDRANELVTDGHRLRDTQKIAIFIFMGGSYHLSYDSQNQSSTDDLVFFVNEKRNLVYRLHDIETEVGNNDDCFLSKLLYDKIKNNLMTSQRSDCIGVRRLENNHGHISQIKTGEGKTTIVSFISALKVLQGYKVDVITSNQVLAADGVREKQKFYGLLGINASHNNPDSGVNEATRKCYKADIVYGSINNFQFDFLRDRFECLDTFGDRKPEDNWVVLDEVDSLLVDQGGNIAKLSSALPGMENLKYVYINIWKALQLNERDVEIEIQAKLEEKKNQLQSKLTIKINELMKKYADKVKNIERDENLNKLLIENKSDLSKNKFIIEQIECEIFKKQLEIFKNYNFTLNSIHNENDIGFSYKDSKLIILTNKVQQVIESNSTVISQDLYDYLIDKLEQKSKTISFSKSSEIELLKAFSNICPFARIEVAEDLNEIDKLENENQEEYEEVEEELSDTYLELVTSKIKGQKEILSDLLSKKLIPSHLHNYANRNFGRWIESALSAKYHYQENQQYKLIDQNGEDIIIPVDNRNTGVSMYNTILSNGVHQFLQIKHNLCLSFESLTSSYISNLGYIKKYGSRILGLTGTLGSTAEQGLLGEVYNLEFSAIPTYKHKNFQEFPGSIVSDGLFFQKISTLALGELLRGTDDDENRTPRSVLIICDSIRDVYEIENAIKSQATTADLNANIKIYTDEAEAGITGATLEPNVIVIATNIAGRGTDFKTSECLEANGGLHVIVAFLPCNQRVQDQALGRTSRQGNYGSGQLVVRLSEIEKIGGNETFSFDQVLKIRDELEKIRISDIRIRKIKELNFKDNLFEKFSLLYSKLKKEHKYDQDPKWNYVLKDLKERWAFWLEEQDYDKSNNDLDESTEFERFLSDEKVAKILNNQNEINIAHNPFYAICLAEEYLELGGKENTMNAKKALNKAIEIGGESEPLYSAYIKLFEIAMIEGGQILERYKEAVAKIFFIPLEKDENYKKNSLNYLNKAKQALKIEQSYLEDLFKEGNLDCIIIGSSSKSRGAISMGYWYSDYDTNRIGERLQMHGVDTNTCFKGRLTKDLITSLPKDLVEDRAIFISFNIGGNTSSDGGIHWIAIILVKHKGVIYLLYKDSKGDFGDSCTKIKQTFISHYGTELKFIQNAEIEQQDDSSCGPMTMNNLEIIAKKIKDEGVNCLISEFRNMTFTSQAEVQELRKIQNPNKSDENETSETKGTNSNLFLKHLQARAACIGVYTGNIDSIIKHIEETNSKDLSLDIGLKASRYLNKLDSTNADQKVLKESISDKDVYELDNIGMGCVYGLKEIHDVPPYVIKSAQAQILSGLSLLTASWLFPPALAVSGPIAGTLISEGITDIITELIKQGGQEFSKKDYIKGKIISYGISIITMGIGAIMSSTKILTKAMNACRNLASKLRACTRFKGVCNFIANNLDKIANYLEKAITKINFAKMCVQEQQKYLVQLQNAKKLKEFQDLQKLLKITDVAMSHGAIIRNIAFSSVVNSFQGVVISVCTEKILIASLNKVMSGLEPNINEWVRKSVTEKVNKNEHLLNSLNDDEINKKLQSLFENSLGEDIGDVLKEVSLGVLRHSSNWKMQLVSLGVDSAVVCGEIMTCTNKICDKLFKNFKSTSGSTCKRDYSNIIDNISKQISGIIYGKIVSLTGKVAITLPKILYRGYKQRQEKIKDKEAIEKHAKRIENAEKADAESRAKESICAYEAVGKILEMNSEEVALASSMGASEKGTSLEEMKTIMEESGVACKIADGTVAVNMLSSQNSDRGVACLQNEQGKGHAIPFFKENGQLMVNDQNNNRIPLEQYVKENGYQNDFKVIVPNNLNDNNMESVKFVINRRRITRCTYPLKYVGQDGGVMFGGAKNNILKHVPITASSNCSQQTSFIQGLISQHYDKIKNMDEATLVNRIEQTQRDGYNPKLDYNALRLHAMKENTTLFGEQNYFTSDCPAEFGDTSRGRVRFLWSADIEKGAIKNLKCHGVVDTHGCEKLVYKNELVYPGNNIDWNLFEANTAANPELRKTI